MAEATKAPAVIRRKNDPESAKRRLARRQRRDARRLRDLAQRFEHEVDAHPDSLIRTDWEAEFLESVPDRIETFGRAYRDDALAHPADRESPLSVRQRATTAQLRRLLGARVRQAEKDRRDADDEAPGAEPTNEPGHCEPDPQDR